MTGDRSLRVLNLERTKVTDAGIAQLRKDNRSLNDRLTHVEMEVLSLRADLLTKDQELKRLRAEHSQLISSNGHEFFSEEERADIVLTVAADPEYGEVMKGTGGFRKFRVARGGER